MTSEFVAWWRPGHHGPSLSSAHQLLEQAFERRFGLLTESAVGGGRLQDCAARRDEPSEALTRVESSDGARVLSPFGDAQKGAQMLFHQGHVEGRPELKKGCLVERDAMVGCGAGPTTGSNVMLPGR